MATHCIICKKDTQSGMKLCNHHYYVKNKERCAKYHSKWREDNKEIIAKKSKIWRNANKEKLSQQSKEYRERNKIILFKKSKEYYFKNKVSIAKKSKIYREDNKEIIKQRKKEYSQRPDIELRRKEKSKTIEYKKMKALHDKRYILKNIDKLLLKQKEYRERNRSKIREKTKSQESREKARIYIKKRKNEHPEVRIATRLRNRLRTAFNHYAKTGKVMTSRKYGINYGKIIKHLKPFPEDLSKYHIDHIKPLCSFELNNSEEVKKAFAPENHQWLLAFDNQSKGGKYKQNGTIQKEKK